MPDYKELYLNLFRATEDAIQGLIAAQRACEEAILSSPDSEITLLKGAEEEEKPEK